MSKPLTVSIVCADLKTSQVITDFLNMYGYTIVCTTQYAFDCVEFVINNKPDIIISDAYLYDLDAIRMYEKLKSMGYDKEIVFACVSKVTDSSLINAVLGCGIDMFTLLPTDFFSLDKKLRNLVLQKREGKQNDNSVDSEQFRIRTYIKNLMHTLGVSPSILGYDYVLDAVYMGVMSKTNNIVITKNIYPEIAKRYNTSPAGVERAIRLAIEKSWLLGNISVINDIFGYSVDAQKGRPSNSVYISMLIEKTKTDLKLQ